MRLMLLLLLILLIAAQVRLWGELREVRELRSQLQEQVDENARLHARNDALAAEVDDLRGGLEALEERARSELGLIREDEEFFLIVDPRVLERQP